MSLNVPTTLSSEDIKEFKRLTFEEYGIQLSDDEARRDGLDLIGFVAVVLEVSDKVDLHDKNSLLE